MKIKKLIALATVICLLVCAALPVSAAVTGTGTEADPIVITASGDGFTVSDTRAMYFKIDADNVTSIAINGVSFASASVVSGGDFTQTGPTTISVTLSAATNDPVVVLAAGQMNYGYQVTVTYTTGTGGEGTGGQTPAEPVGTIQNPISMENLPYEGTATFETEANEALFYSWVATADGRVTVTVDAENAQNGWQHKILVWNAEYGYDTASSEMMTSGDETPAATGYLDVNEGDLVYVNVGTYAMNETTYWPYCPAGSVDFEVSFEKAGTENLPYDLAAKGYYVTVPTGEDGIWVSLESEMGAMVLPITSAAVYYNGQQVKPNEDGEIVVNVEPGVQKLQLVNSGEESTYAVFDVYNVGSVNNPIVISASGTYALEQEAYDFSDGKWYVYTAKVDGVLNVNVIEEEDDWSFTVKNATQSVVAGPYSSADENPRTSYAMSVKAGDKIMINVDGAFASAALAIDFEVLFVGDEPGTEGNPINVNVPADMAGADIAAGAEVLYSISGYLNGQILTVAGENITVTVNGTAVEGKNGIYAVELTGTPKNTVVISNTGNEEVSYEASINWPVGHEDNPIVVSSSNELTSAAVSAGAEVNYLLNGKLNGNILTVKGEGAYIVVDGKKYEAVDGVASVKIDGGATVAVAIGNAGTKDASYVVSFTAAPVSGEDVPNNGDVAVLTAVMGMLMSACGVAVIGKKKEN